MTDGFIEMLEPPVIRELEELIVTYEANLPPGPSA